MSGSVLKSSGLREWVADLRALGLDLLDARRSKHWRVHVRKGAGRPFWVTLPVSPGDHRSRANTLKQVRHAIAANAAPSPGP